MPEADYHDLREAQERAAAGVAMNRAARAIHCELADRHAEMATSIRDDATMRDVSARARLKRSADA